MGWTDSHLHQFVGKGGSLLSSGGCGGIWGYENLRDIIKDRSMMIWLPNKFDPERFDLAGVNRVLFRRKWKRFRDREGTNRKLNKRPHRRGTIREADSKTFIYND